jgi:hypothetical protein
VDVKVERLRPSPRGHLEPIPNINVSGRALPDIATRPDPRAPIRLDREAVTRRLSDREIFAVAITVTDDELVANPGLTLAVDLAPQLFTLLDQSLKPTGPADDPPAPIPLAPAKEGNTKTVDGIQLYVEARTYWGTPMVPAHARRDIAFRFLDGAGKLVLEQTRFNGADLRTADLTLIGDDAAPEHLFICDVGENGPSVLDVSDAARASGVPLTTVPLDVNLGDSWLQDQFQLGLATTRENNQRVVVHLPRMTHDSALVPGTPNLRNFTDSHFPSDTVGVVKDFWAPKVTLSDGSQSQDFTVAQSYLIYKQLVRIARLLQVMLQLLLKIPRAPTPPRVPDDDLTNLYEVRKLIDQVAELLRAQTQASAQQREQISAIPNAISELSTVLTRERDTVSFLVEVAGNRKEFHFTEATAAKLRDFFQALRALHSSQNYGGNIEVSPPTADLPAGKILTGTIPSEPLAAFLGANPQQPIASAYTDWLAVGHIDEIAAFANTPGRPQVLRAAPEAALRLLDRALSYQQAGVAVTRLFRGKKWIHEVAVGAVDSHQPPNFYRWIATPRDPNHPNDPHGPYDITALVSSDFSSEPDYGNSAFHDDRRFLLYSLRKKVSARYAAFATCADVLAGCALTNHAVEALMLSDGYRYADEPVWDDYYHDDNYKRTVLPKRLDKVLAAEFRGWPRVPMPVLFDKTTSFLHGERTQALIPASVNLQTLGKHVLVPRPYGPRMPVADAVRFVNELEPRDGGVRGAKPNEQWVRARGLDKTWHWTRDGEQSYQATLGTTPTEFEPEYDEMWRSIMQAVSVSTTTWDPPSLWEIQHRGDPPRNHPVSQPETLREIAGYFKDGFPEFKNCPVDYCSGDTANAHPRQDKYERDIQTVMEKIDRANPGAFDNNGNLLSKRWLAIEIPEDTVDVFELQTQALLESLGMQVHWVDSWYYHVHGGGIHCATNVLRAR